MSNRILFTLALLGVYRIGVFVTTPGVNRAVMGDVIAQQGGFLGLFNLFSGGALEQLSVFALGIMPYITASIILQLLQVVVPKLNELKAIPEIKELIPLFGEYDIIAKIEAKDYDGIGKVVIQHIRSIDGVIDTKTLTAVDFLD